MEVISDKTSPSTPLNKCVLKNVERTKGFNMSNLKALNTILFLVTGILMGSLSFAGSSSSSGFLGENKYNCFPSHLFDAGYVIYITQNTSTNSITGKLGEITKRGETLLPMLYEFDKILISQHLVLKNKDFDIEFLSMDLPQTLNKYEPAIMKIYENLRAPEKEIKLYCYLSEEN